MARKDSILRLRQILIKRRDGLRKSLAGDLSLLKDFNQKGGGDLADCASDATHDEISSRLAEVESRELAQIEHALEQMREGKYGICDLCSEPIPLARLNALPYATHCIKCQREVERNGGDAHYDADWGRVSDSDGESDVSINDIEMDVS